VVLIIRAVRSVIPGYFCLWYNADDPAGEMAESHVLWSVVLRSQDGSYCD